MTLDASDNLLLFGGRSSGVRFVAFDNAKLQ